MPQFALSISLGVGLLACFAAIGYLMRVIKALREERRAAEIEIWNYMGRVYEAVEQIHLRSDTSQVELPPAPDEPIVGLNLQSRSKALRLLRMGQSMERVSTQLKIPLSELEMLLKVNDLVMQQFTVGLSPQMIPQGTK